MKLQPVRKFPILYEINACPFLRQMSAKYGRELSLANIPDEEWQYFAKLGFDLIWLMGVWQRSAGSAKEALRHPELRHEYDRALPGWKDEDIIGSPYAILSYELNPALGGAGELIALKKKLNGFGMRLILDFVPNHLAFDHKWVTEFPDRFIHRENLDGQVHPSWFFTPETHQYIARSRYFAHGRDPNFPPWTDTVQVNFFSQYLRVALTDELHQISEMADGVRCDMAMLALNDVFDRIWGKLVENQRPQTEFWSDAIGEIKEKRSDFLFIAEAYWDSERQLQALGFDFTYDKALYDKLRGGNADDIARHLAFDVEYQRKSVHFVENHDEPRAASAFGLEPSLAAAAIAMTAPGLRLLHNGQTYGSHIRVPVQLARRQEEQENVDVKNFYERLLMTCNDPAFHSGEWELAETGEAGAGGSFRNILSWTWKYAKGSKVVAVNYSGVPASAWLKLPIGFSITDSQVLRDDLSSKNESLSLRRTERHDLLLELKPWESKIFSIAAE